MRLVGNVPGSTLACSDRQSYRYAVFQLSTFDFRLSTKRAPTVPQGLSTFGKFQTPLSSISASTRTTELGLIK